MQPYQCGFFDWIDEPTCPRSREFGQKVQEKIVKLEAEIKELKTNESMMKTNKRQKNLVQMLLGSWVFFLLITLFVLWGAKFGRNDNYLPY